MYGLPDTLRPLSAAEEQVMLAVWACPGAAARRDISQTGSYTHLTLPTTERV